MKMSNKLYDALKWIALVCLPAIATFISVLWGIWGFPYGEPIIGTVVAVNALIGALIGVSSAKYRKETNNKGE
jgi:hypothetical protein